MKSPARMKFTTVQQYLSSLPDDVRRVVEELRSVIQATAPDAEEVISYNMPAFKQKSILVYYAAFKDHIGFFPTSSPIRKTLKFIFLKLSSYCSGVIKGMM